jgi:hypothetical protein
MSNKRNRPGSYIPAFLMFVASNCSCFGQNRVSVVTSHADPALVVRQAIQPLFQHKKGADSKETSFFSTEFKHLADAYFAADDNARDFDADWLLGMQDWSGLTPSFSTFILDERRAKVKIDFTMADKSKGDTIPTLPVIYMVTFDDRYGWKIDDVVYGDGITLRDMIAHNSWCRATFHDVDKFEECRISSFR